MAPSCHSEPIRCAQGKLREGSGAVGVEMLRYAQHDKVLEYDKMHQYDRVLLALLDQALRVCYSCGEENGRFDNWRGESMGADLSEIILNGVLRSQADLTGTGDEHGQETV